MAARRHPLRSYIIALFRRGDLVSVHEAMLICDASRQAISKWIKAERINIEAHRLQHLAKLRTAAQRQLDGLPALRRPTKAQMRASLEKAVERFNHANAKASESVAQSERNGARGPPRDVAGAQVEREAIVVSDVPIVRTQRRSRDHAQAASRVKPDLQ